MISRVYLYIYIYRYIHITNYNDFISELWQGQQLHYKRVSLPFLQSQDSFLISHGFTNSQQIFIQTRNFLRKQTQAPSTLLKIAKKLTAEYNRQHSS